MIDGLPPFPVDEARQQLLILLVAGHLIGDFLIQPRRIAMGKARPGVLAVHVGLVAAAHAAALIPFLTWPLALVVVLVSLVHGVVDAIKAAWTRTWPGPAAVFFADQAAHLLVLIGIWAVYVHLADVPTPHLTEAWLPYFVVAAVLIGGLSFVWMGGSVIVVATLATLGAAPAADGGIHGGGHLIGALERTIIVVLILFGEWAAVALLLAAKSIARFEELKDRRFSEYYLVGTLTSILTAVAAALAIRAVIH